ncbi:sulfotransferase [Thalassobaculum sp.]|uniref:sulfotransferase family protein n=1 Tax=Thalassobaculum sp. TaxID=2022740 RepID=UPI0032EB40CB
MTAQSSTSHQRRPNLFVVGAPKCGTTSVCHYLDQHPEVFISTPKEPLFFCTDQQHDEPWRVSDPDRYLALFEAGAGRRWRGEGSVWYLSSTIAARRIHNFSPDSRIVIMLRNPVDMAVSLHAQFLFSGNENIRDFEKAYSAQAARRRGRRIPWRAHMPEGLLYADVGRYAAQVERYLDVFPREHVKVLIFETFFRDVAAGYRELLEFLDIDVEFAPDLAAKNERHNVRSALLQRFLTKLPELWGQPESAAAGGSRSTMRQRLERARARLQHFNMQGSSFRLTPDIRRRLHADFADDIARLEALICRDLSVWRHRNLDGIAPGFPSGHSLVTGRTAHTEA